MTTNWALTFEEIMKRSVELARDVWVPGSYCGERFNSMENIKTAVRESIKIWCDKTDRLLKMWPIPLRDNVYVYDIPEDIFRVKAVRFSGICGWALFPLGHGAFDSAGRSYCTDGDPYLYFRNLLPARKLWVYPIPYQDGSTFTRDDIEGLLRAIVDVDTGEYMPWDAAIGALRDISGDVYINWTDQGHIVRDLMPMGGNLLIHYVRYPEYTNDPAAYPDAEIPDHDHQNIPLGAAWQLLEFWGEEKDDARKEELRLKFFQQIYETGGEHLREMMTQGFEPA